MAKAIMIQGTTSNAGKSLITAALCRILKQDGFTVAPFKSQNMALNSFITEEGLEMGRAQVMQCEAAGITPSVQMNPILLKPTNDMGSQVIVNGEVVGTMRAVDYFRYKKSLIPQIMQAYQGLQEQYDVIVLEGAGSPAEINLKQDDIVNMGMAKMARSPVLLAGDIDRGGVFASLVGTLTLLESDERRMVKGTIINKFRGDREILRPGERMLEQLSGIPNLGVIPMLSVDIDDEDSLSERFQTSKDTHGWLEIVIVRLPRISNFTDFHPLERIAGVQIRYVASAKELGFPDLIILPGTKNTMSDLKWLRETGLEAAIGRLVSKGTAIFGICGGYQMMGNRLFDPNGAEEGGEMRGMELLPVNTVFSEQKTRTRVSGITEKLDGFFSGLSELPFEGYEIHMGCSTRTDGRPFHFLQMENGKADGMAVKNVCGTYLHGFFDQQEVVAGLLYCLCRQKGIDPDQLTAGISAAEYKQQQYDQLADGVRNSLDMEQIYRILEEGID